MRFNTPEGYYTITPLPSQPNAAVCTDFTIYPKFRGKGAAHRLKAHQMQTLHELGYTFAICTTQNKNLAQAKVLMKAGWTRGPVFFDQRAVSGVCLWTVTIFDKGDDHFCPECGNTMYDVHREGDMLAPECTYKVCDNCGYQTQPE